MTVSKNIKRNPFTCFMFVFFCCLASVNSLAEGVWIDVRSTAEYERDHIEGDVLIPHQTITKGIQNLGLEKDADIYVYCAAGIRAEMAKNALQKLGYNNVYNVGGINDARRLREK